MRFEISTTFRNKAFILQVAAFTANVVEDDDDDDEVDTIEPPKHPVVVELTSSTRLVGFQPNVEDEGDDDDDC